MNAHIGLFRRIVTEIKLGFKEDDTNEEIQFLSKLISIGLFFDKKMTEKELLFAKSILNKELTEEDSELAWDNILIYLDKYKNIETRWQFAKNKTEVIEHIVGTNNYHYAKFLSDLLESDTVSKEEEESFKVLKKITDEHERMLIKKKLL